MIVLFRIFLCMFIFPAFLVSYILTSIGYGIWLAVREGYKSGVTDTNFVKYTTLEAER